MSHAECTSRASPKKAGPYLEQHHQHRVQPKDWIACLDVGNGEAPKRGDGVIDPSSNELDGDH